MKVKNKEKSERPIKHLKSRIKKTKYKNEIEFTANGKKFKVKNIIAGKINIGNK